VNYRGFEIRRTGRGQFTATGAHGIFGWFATRELAQAAIDAYLDHPAYPYRAAEERTA